MQSDSLLVSSGTYKVYRDKVVQGTFTAKALSDTEITSDYQSPAIKSISSLIRFKFSINSRDNEMPAGIDHYVCLVPENGQAENVSAKFGQQFTDTTGKTVTDLPYDTRWTVKLDMRDMLRSFSEKGFYTLYNGNNVYKADFKGVYIAGNTPPLSWDFENLCNNKAYELTDPDNDGIYEVTLLMNPKPETKKSSSWKLSADLSGLPEYHSDQVLADALFKLSLEEMKKDIRKDSTFMAGEKWDGVWTRDISYSIVLSLAALDPKVSKNSLMRKVKNKRIIQDTGTGGSWPVSTDRMTWALAAWEVYKVTADREWLEQAFEIIRNSAADDMHAAFDPATGLLNGESSFLDWREQTYPKWMEPIDIYVSKNLGTNAVHYQTYMILAEMANILGQPSDEYTKTAEKIKAGINRYLWMGDKSYYAQYIYGKYTQVVSPRSEALGEALCVLFGIADEERQRQVVARTPVTEYGIPCIYPQTPDIQPYHNNAVWPFVEAYWTLASAKAGNEASVLHGLGSIYRQSALFLTNKENMVAENGDHTGTAINSDRQLWSVAGNLAIVLKLYFGMDFMPGGIEFHPFVPESFTGEKELSGFSYRKMKLSLKLIGFGNTVISFRLDGKEQDRNFLPGDLTGEHTVEIVLGNKKFPKAKINLQPVLFEAFPPRPQDPEEKDFITAEMENFTGPSNLPLAGFSGKGFVETSKQRNQNISFSLEVPEAGEYFLDFRYSNGSGPVNTDNKCAIRTLKQENRFVGTVILPQRGKEEWSNWGYSNALKVTLPKGKTSFTLSLEASDENMNGEVNTAMLDRVRLLKVRK
jgi:hypothetical protein